MLEDRMTPEDVEVDRTYYINGGREAVSIELDPYHRAGYLGTHSVWSVHRQQWLYGGTLPECREWVLEH